MSQFRVKSIDESLARQIRETMRDPIYGSPVHAEPATGYGPCRLCLKTFDAGDSRILFLYNAFSAGQEADLAGPVFIHAGQCRAYEDASLFPEEIASLPIVLRAYDRDRRCVFETMPNGGSVTSSLEALLGSPSVAFVHVRNAEAKCFIARVERAHTPADQPNVFVSSR